MKNLIKSLEELVKNPQIIAKMDENDRVSLMKLAAQIAHPTKAELKARRKEKKKINKESIVSKDRQKRAETGIRQARQQTVFMAPLLLPEDTLNQLKQKERECSTPRNCYVCKKEFTQLHFFYDSMCADCGDLNYSKRFQMASLKGRVVLITGSRLKIGYQATVMMLKAGAHVIATTRFPVDSALRFSREPDFNEWKDRLEIYGLDLRHTPSVEIFCQYLLQKLSRLDIIVHNAAQTVRRPPGFYTHLMKEELKPFENLNPDLQKLLFNYESCKKTILTQSQSSHSQTQDFLSMNHGEQNSSNKVFHNDLSLSVLPSGGTTGIGLCASAQLSQIPYKDETAIELSQIFPSGKLDADLQQVDLRETNSWRYKITDVPTAELLEVQLVNAIAPFVISSKLIPLMKKDYTGDKHIVNVTAMEGKFHRFKKSERHPHTNMAKAALNMLTHTASADLAKHGIFMNAVDTGWVTDENPAEMSQKSQAVHDFQPPLDIVDGAARVCDPFFYGMLTGHHWSGKFLKDYKPIDW